MNKKMICINIHLIYTFQFIFASGLNKIRFDVLYTSFYSALHVPTQMQCLMRIRIDVSAVRSVCIGSYLIYQSIILHINLHKLVYLLIYAHYYTLYYTPPSLSCTIRKSKTCRDKCKRGGRCKKCFIIIFNIINMLLYVTEYVIS